MNHLKITISILLLILSIIPANSQELFKDKNIDSSFSKYTQKPREIAYVHLNKSTYIKNEDLGFTAYLFSKQDKKIAIASKNLYIVIEDSNKNIIKKQLLKVNNGIAYSSITIDSLFTSGTYKLFAYTNWMKNFREQNFFVETFRVIDPKVEKEIKNEKISDKIDAQFLPESGHLLTGTLNTVGVILKNELGFGVSNISGEILNSKKETVSTFNVNKLGTGRFSFTPNINENYMAKFKSNDKEFLFDIIKSEPKGVILSVNNRKKKIYLSIATNSATKPFLKNKKYKLTLHNGSTIKSFDILFDDKNSIEKIFNPKNLTSGVNVFTLFDENNNPIAERLFFNHNNIDFLKVSNIIKEQENDSLNVTLSFDDIDTKKMNNISISVLPEGTKSYSHHHNIASYTLLQTYVKGAIENGHYYFENLSEKKKFDLDNLLITQGWSSYKWYDIFNYKPRVDYFFEKGITIKANVNNTEKSKYVLYSVNKAKPNYYVLKENEKEFLATELFPSPEEKIEVSKIEGKGKLVPATLYPQFYPNTIPKLDLEYSVLNNFNNRIVESNLDNITTKLSLNKVQKLDEIVIKADLEKIRIENIKNRTLGRVYVIDEHFRKLNLNVANFINGKGGYIGGVYAANNNVWITTNGASSIYGGGTPTIYLDGHQLADIQMLYYITTSEIDYIDINRNGMGEGVRAGGGVIKIYTNPELARTKKEVRQTQKFKFPLTFNTPKEYYVPTYKDYTNNFYRDYGTIAWLPINTANNNGAFSFKLKNFLDNNITLFIEGTANDGSYISETKTIKFN